MFCKWCGVPNDDDAVFCTGCGRAVADQTNPINVPITDDGLSVRPPMSGESVQLAPGGASSATRSERRKPTVPILVVVVVALGLTLGGALLLGERENPQTLGEAGEVGSLTTDPAGDPSAESVPPGGDVSATVTEEVSTSEAPGAEPGGVPAGDGVLRLGGLVPQTGNLTFLGPAIQAGIDLAVEDINAAGGVRDAPIEFVAGDSGDNGDVANATVDRLIGEGVDGFIGAASSSVSLTVIDKVTENGKLLFSPSNTSTAFTNYPDNGLYFRTSPSDEAQGAALADLVIEDGNTTVVLMMLDGEYATEIGDVFTGRLTDSGGSLLDSRVYDGRADPFEAQVAALRDTVLANSPDAVVIIGFDETSAILDGLVAAGDGPPVRAFYGTDANVGNYLGSLVQSPAALAGMRGTLPGVDVVGLLPDFAARLDAVSGGLDDYSYSTEAYDAVVITALAAEASGTDDAVGFAPQIADVTRGGQVCTSFAECRDLIRNGVDIDYDGMSGPVDMSDVGEPTVASILTLEFDSNGQVFVVGTQVTRT